MHYGLWKYRIGFNPLWMKGCVSVWRPTDHRHQNFVSSLLWFNFNKQDMKEKKNYFFRYQVKLQIRITMQSLHSFASSNGIQISRGEWGGSCRSLLLKENNQIKTKLLYNSLIHTYMIWFYWQSNNLLVNRPRCTFLNLLALYNFTNVWYSFYYL